MTTASSAGIGRRHAKRQANEHRQQRPNAGRPVSSPQEKQRPGTYGTAVRKSNAGMISADAALNCARNASRRATTPSSQQRRSVLSASLCATIACIRSGVSRERGAILSASSAVSATRNPSASRSQRMPKAGESKTFGVRASIDRPHRGRLPPAQPEHPEQGPSTLAEPPFPDPEQGADVPARKL